MVGVEDRAALERGHGPHNPHFAGRRLHDDFGAGGDVTSFFVPARDPEAVTWRRRISNRFPAEARGGGVEHGAQPVVF